MVQPAAHLPQAVMIHFPAYIIIFLFNCQHQYVHTDVGSDYINWLVQTCWGRRGYSNEERVGCLEGTVSFLTVFV